MTRKASRGVAGSAAVAMALAILPALQPTPALGDAIVAGCDPGNEDSAHCLEQREAIAERRLEEMLEQPTPPPAEEAAPAAVPDAGRHPQIRVPLDELDDEQIEVELDANPPPAAAEAPPPPHDAEERGLDPLIE